MRIHLTSVFVYDQDEALRFYTEVLGFVKKTEIPLGEAKWLTVVSPDSTEGPELLFWSHPIIPRSAPTGRHSSLMASPSPHSRSTTPMTSTSGSRATAWFSPSSQWRWAE